MKPSPRRRIVKRFAVALILLSIVITGVAFDAQLSAAAWLSEPVRSVRTWVNASLEPVSQLPVLRSVGRRETLAQSAGGTTSGPTVQTDKADYQPGETVIITGSGFGGEEVRLQVTHADGTPDGGAGHEPWSVFADGDGSFTATWHVDPDDSLGSRFLLTADGVTSGLHAETTFTDANPSADLDQCANDPAPSSHLDGCSASATDWVNGNLGASKSVYLEGDSIPYRLRFDNLSTTGTQRVDIEWDTTKSGTHAIDYITTWNRTVGSANPCLGVAGCTLGSDFTDFPIPKDPQVDNGSGVPITQIAGFFRMWGGTITGVSYLPYPDGTGFAGDKSTRIRVSFQADVANPVLAWGGHIAQRRPVAPADPAFGWGDDAAAVSISGSPYHTRLDNLNGSGGNQDRSLSADAVIFPGSITIIKDATPEGSQSFSFTASPPPLTNFNLVDDGTSANTKLFSDITNFTTYSVAESAPSTWTLTGISCSVTSPNGGSRTVTLPSVSIDLREGENVSCTFTNTRQSGSLRITKTFDPLTSGFVGTFAIDYDCDDGTANDGTVNLAAGGSATIGSIPVGTTCVVSEPTLPTAPSGWTFGTPVLTDSQAPTTDGTVVISSSGATYTVDVTNSITKDLGNLKLLKALTGGPDGYTGPFTIDYNCDDGTAHDGSVSVAAGSSSTITGIPTGTSCTVSETPPTPPTGYTFGTPTFSPSATVTIATKDATVEVTTNNTLTRDLGNFKITKSTINPDGALLPAAFTGTYNCGTGYTGNFSVADGASQTITGIPTGNTCSVVETAPAAIPGYSWGPITYTPATIVIGTKGGTFEIVVGNSITRDRGTIIVIKNAKPAQGSFAFTTTGTGYNPFTLTGSTAGGGNQNSQTLVTGNYTVKESTPLGWLLTGIGGSTDPSTPYNCTVTGSGGSTGVGDLATQTATITLNKGDTVTCVFENTGQGVTRTQGFWATHTKLAEPAWFGGTSATYPSHTFPGVSATPGIGDQTMCSTLSGYNGTTVGKNVNTLARLMGGFWSDVSKKSTGAKRTSLDQARMQLLQQLLAAELNASAFGAVPSGGTGKFAAWEAAYCTGNATQVKTALKEAASFNTSGDSGTFTPGTSADSKYARSVADIPFWNTLP